MRLLRLQAARPPTHMRGTYTYRCSPYYESRDAIFFDFERVGHIARERYVQTHKKYLRTVAHARGLNAAHSTYTRQAKFGKTGGRKAFMSPICDSEPSASPSSRTPAGRRT